MPLSGVSFMHLWGQESWVTKKGPPCHTMASGHVSVFSPEHGGPVMIISQTDSVSKGGSLSALSQQLEQYVRLAAQEGRSLYEVERGVFDMLLSMGQSAIEQFLQQQGDGDLGATVPTAEGVVLYRSAERQPRSIRTIFGVHTITTYVYADHPGTHEKIVLRPIDARLQLSEGKASYLFEEFSQCFCLDQSFGMAAENMQRIFRQEVSVDTLERINGRLGDQADVFLCEVPTPPAKEEGQYLVFTGDAKGVPIVRHDGEAFAAFVEGPERAGNRKMATLAGVYSVDAYERTAEDVVAALFRDPFLEPSPSRPAPQFKIIRGSFVKVYDADSSDPTVVPGAFEAFSWAEIQIANRLRPYQTLIRLMDGQVHLWEAADACLESHLELLTVDILDILHVSHYVWRAAKVFESNAKRQEHFARDRLLRILQGQALTVIRGFRRMATTRKLTGKAGKEIRVVCHYLENNLQRMKYDEYLRMGYPIATGVIEGACRHLVKDRMERSGMRWRLAGAQAMLNVRAVFLSSYWDVFQTFRFEKEQNVLHPHKDLIAGYHVHLAA